MSRRRSRPTGSPGTAADPEVNARGLLAHRDTEYEEWGFSGSIAYTPSEDGRGLSMRLGSAWGATQSGVQSLWSRQDASGLVSNAAFEAAQRYQVELRYGLDGKKGRARWEPFVGVESGQPPLTAVATERCWWRTRRRRAKGLVGG